MACKGCEQRRATMLLMAEAGKQWTSNPTGPNIRDIFYKLRAEAIQRGELDGSVEPKQD